MVIFYVYSVIIQIWKGCFLPFYNLSLCHCFEVFLCNIRKYTTSAGGCVLWSLRRNWKLSKWWVNAFIVVYIIHGQAFFYWIKFFNLHDRLMIHCLIKIFVINYRLFRNYFWCLYFTKIFTQIHVTCCLIKNFLLKSCVWFCIKYKRKLLCVVFEVTVKEIHIICNDCMNITGSRS